MNFGRAGAPVALALLLASLAAGCSSTARVSDVYMSLDADGARKRNVFFTDTKEVHCVIEAGIGRDGVTIESLIRQVQRYDFDRNLFVDADRVVAQAESTPGKAEGITKLELQLAKPTGGTDLPFDAGRFICEVRLDGQLQGTATFNVQFPDCPTAQILPTTICFGTYPDGKICPRYGASSTEPAGCTCSKDLGWRCP